MADAAVTVASFLAALALRFDAPSAQFDLYSKAYAWFIPVLLLCRLSSFLVLRLYSRVWRYASSGELLAVVIAVLGSSSIAYVVLFSVISVQSPAIGFPRSVAFIDTVVVAAAAGAWRFGVGLIGVGRVRGTSAKTPERALVAGGGAAALAVLRELAANSALGLKAIGVVADEIPSGHTLMSVPVLGGLDSMTRAIERERATVVLLALPSADGTTLRKLVRQAEAAGARCLTVPSVAEVVAGRVTVNALRDIEVEDLLRRAPARIDLAEVSAWLQGRRVLITGAGGTIGSELARQVFHFGARELILLGRGENSIFEIVESLRLDEQRTCQVTPVIQDVRDRASLFRTFARAKPDVVFHAAAHKHVPLMELYPEEAVATNVLGTLNVIAASLEHGVSSLVFISTDKAVNPSSVMGATKRLGELLVAAAARESARSYVCVRFGNVLSSRGSIVPTFHKQLARGGPLTITHPDATRYFMTIPEAIQLVLQAAVLARAGDTFVLDMGEPVRIVQLAEDLARLHGMEVGTDVELQFVGLRPGEKLVEDLYFAHEHPTATPHEAIRRVEQANIAPVDLAADLEQLAAAVGRGDREAIIALLRRAVPEYVPIGRDSSDPATRLKH